MADGGAAHSDGALRARNMYSSGVLMPAHEVQLKLPERIVPEQCTTPDARWAPGRAATHTVAWGRSVAASEVPCHVPKLWHTEMEVVIVHGGMVEEIKE